MKIVIYGVGKSGTSALFYKVKNSLPSPTIALFEPSSFGLRDRVRHGLRAAIRGHFRPNVIAKVLPCDPRPVRVRDFDGFDRQVLLVRDPRDVLISSMLYRSYHAAGFDRDDLAMEFLELLRRKEAAPQAVPLIDVIQASERQLQTTSQPWAKRYAAQAVERPLAFHASRPRLPVFHYEQMIDGQFEPLEDILGFPLKGSHTVPPALERVVRTKARGTWRNWFTPSDVDAIRPILQPYLDRYYPKADWDLDSAPRIDSNHGSRYVVRLINERRASLDLAALPLPT